MANKIVALGLVAASALAVVAVPVGPVSAETKKHQAKTSSTAGKTTSKKDAAPGKKDASAAKKTAVSTPAPKPAKNAKATPPAKPDHKTRLAAQPSGPTPLPKPRPRQQVASAGGELPVELLNPESVPAPSTFTTAALTTSNTPLPVAAPPSPLAIATGTGTSPEELAALRRVADFMRKDRIKEGTEAASVIASPVARKLAEWIILRDEAADASFERYAAFITANPSWPSVGLLRRRAENALWEDRRDPATIRAFFSNAKPTSTKGRLALARALLAQGDRGGAAVHAREAWRRDSLARDLESKTFEAFGDLLTRADHKARMDARLYAEDDAAALRAASRLGDTERAIAKAFVAVTSKAGNAKALLDAVPSEARRDPAYVFARAQWLRRNDKIAEAGQVMLMGPRDPAQAVDPEQWWIERRLLARKLLDIGDARTAYRVAADAATPEKENPRVDQHFTAGWIALRFLNDPRTAMAHFAQIPRGTIHPTSLARAGYWQGRAAEALGQQQEARVHYQRAARYSAAYYGQLARARLGLPELALHPAPDVSGERGASLRRLEVVRAAELLYAIDERDLLVPFMIDLAERTTDTAALAMLGEIAHRNKDARAVLLIGKGGLSRGHPLDHYAFPTIGIPRYQPIGTEVELSLVYAIARQESAFNPKAVSVANAMGLMQVMPGTGRLIAKKFGASFDVKRMLSDPAYNTQLGAAVLGDLLNSYRGSYILTFVGYNAGPGRARQWVEQYGDPRDPKVDPIDWVERIPISETRNYVQRIMENMQVYRARFAGSQRLTIEADLRRGGN